jgi:hypothetical protein
LIWNKGEEYMNSNQKTARIVAILIILALASSLLSGLFLESLNAPNSLEAVSNNEVQVLIGVIMLVTLTLSVVSIPIVMYPIFKRSNERVALGYVGARFFEGIGDVIMIICPLLIVALSREFVHAGSVLTSDFQTSSTLILSLSNWIDVLENIPYCLGVMMFSTLLYQSKLVPRWLAIWGFIGGIILLARVPISLFIVASELTSILAIPILLNELVLAGWLIVKGFKSSDEKLDS